MMSISLVSSTITTIVLIEYLCASALALARSAPLYYYGNGYTNQRHPLGWCDFPAPIDEVEDDAPFVADGIPGQLRPLANVDRPSLTVMAGPGVSIYAVSGNVVVEQDLLERTPAILRGENKNHDAIDEAPAEDSEEFATHDEGCEEEEEKEKENRDDCPNSQIQSALAKSSLLHRAGLAGNSRARKSGRSSRAKQHVTKRTTSGRSSRGASLQRVVGAVRTAASAAAATKKTKSDGDGTLKSSIQSSIHKILDEQDGHIQQQSIQSIVPPGSTSIGLLGEPVLEKLPQIPPEPGKVLLRRDGAGLNPEMFIRSSIPHSSDDTHIANLRLSVFSGFDIDQQDLFRSRSLESINSRRRRGSVILVAEIENKEPVRNVEQQRYISSAHDFGYHGVLVAPDRGTKLVSASTGRVGVENEIQNELERQSTSGSLSIIGTAECSHQEFVGTILGRTRRKGSLMYVTEVAVQTDRRRSGTGKMLLRGVDRIARTRNVETVFLHVDVNNQAAHAMYEGAGYTIMDRTDPIYAQFTASLNLHDGATHGRRHYLMAKDTTTTTTTTTEWC